MEASPSSIASGKAASETILASLEDYLGSRGGQCYLVCDHVTVADIMVVIYIARGLEWVLDAAWRDMHVNIMRYFKKLVEWEPIKTTVPKFNMIDSANRGL